MCKWLLVLPVMFLIGCSSVVGPCELRDGFPVDSAEWEYWDLRCQGEEIEKGLATPAAIKAIQDQLARVSASLVQLQAALLAAGNDEAAAVVEEDLSKIDEYALMIKSAAGGGVSTSAVIALAWWFLRKRKLEKI